jgi:hypothetical protein
MEKQTLLSEPPREAIDRGYEVGDVSLRAAMWWIIGSIIFAIVAHVFLTTVWHVEYHRAADADQARSAITDEEPPAGRPPLQPSVWHDRTPYEDLKVMRSDEVQVFDSIGWKTDEKTHLPHVPDEIVNKVSTRPGMPKAPAGGSQ